MQGTAENLTTTYMTSSIWPARFRMLSSTRWASIREAVTATKSYERRKFASRQGNQSVRTTFVGRGQRA